jgi:hypothetical protein
MAFMFEKLLKMVRNLGTPDGGAPAGKEIEPVSYNGFLIRPAPRHEGSHWHIAGSIIAEANPEGPVHEFIRADTFSTHDEAVAFTVRKAQQIINERGARLFE